MAASNNVAVVKPMVQTKECRCCKCIPAPAEPDEEHFNTYEEELAEWQEAYEAMSQQQPRPAPERIRNTPARERWTDILDWDDASVRSQFRMALARMHQRTNEQNAMCLREHQVGSYRETNEPVPRLRSPIYEVKCYWCNRTCKTRLRRAI